MGNKQGASSCASMQDRHRPDTRSKNWSFHAMDGRRYPGMATRSTPKNESLISGVKGQSSLLNDSKCPSRREMSCARTKVMKDKKCPTQQEMSCTMKNAPIDKKCTTQREISCTVNNVLYETKCPTQQEISCNTKNDVHENKCPALPEMSSTTKNILQKNNCSTQPEMYWEKSYILNEDKLSSQRDMFYERSIIINEDQLPSHGEMSYERSNIIEDQLPSHGEMSCTKGQLLHNKQPKLNHALPEQLCHALPEAAGRTSIEHRPHENIGSSCRVERSAEETFAPQPYLRSDQDARKEIINSRTSQESRNLRDQHSQYSEPASTFQGTLSVIPPLSQARLEYNSSLKEVDPWRGESVQNQSSEDNKDKEDLWFTQSEESHRFEDNSTEEYLWFGQSGKYHSFDVAVKEDFVRDQFGKSHISKDNIRYTTKEAAIDEDISRERSRDYDDWPAVERDNNPLHTRILSSLNKRRTKMANPEVRILHDHVMKSERMIGATVNIERGNVEDCNCRGLGVENSNVACNESLVRHDNVGGTPVLLRREIPQNHGTSHIVTKRMSSGESSELSWLFPSDNPSTASSSSRGCLARRDAAQILPLVTNKDGRMENFRQETRRQGVTESVIRGSGNYSVIDKSVEDMNDDSVGAFRAYVIRDLSPIPFLHIDLSPIHSPHKGLSPIPCSQRDLSPINDSHFRDLSSTPISSLSSPTLALSSLTNSKVARISYPPPQHCENLRSMSLNQPPPLVRAVPLSTESGSHSVDTVAIRTLSTFGESPYLTDNRFGNRTSSFKSHRQSCDDTNVDISPPMLKDHGHSECDRRICEIDKDLSSHRHIAELQGTADISPYLSKAHRQLQFDQTNIDTNTSLFTDHRQVEAVQRTINIDRRSREHLRLDFENSPRKRLARISFNPQLANSNSRLTSPNSRLTSPNSRLTSSISRLTSPNSRLTSPSSRMTSPISRLTRPTSRLTSAIPRLTGPILRLTSPNSRLTSPQSHAAESIEESPRELTKRHKLGHRAAILDHRIYKQNETNISPPLLDCPDNPNMINNCPNTANFRPEINSPNIVVNTVDNLNEGRCRLNLPLDTSQLSEQYGQQLSSAGQGFLNFDANVSMTTSSSATTPTANDSGYGTGTSFTSFDQSGRTSRACHDVSSGNSFSRGDDLIGCGNSNGEHGGESLIVTTITSGEFGNVFDNNRWWKSGGERDDGSGGEKEDGICDLSVQSLSDKNPIPEVGSTTDILTSESHQTCVIVSGGTRNETATETLAPPSIANRSEATFVVMETVDSTNRSGHVAGLQLKADKCKNLLDISESNVDASGRFPVRNEEDGIWTNSLQRLIKEIRKSTRQFDSLEGNSGCENLAKETPLIYQAENVSVSAVKEIPDSFYVDILSRHVRVPSKSTKQKHAQHIQRSWSFSAISRLNKNLIRSDVSIENFKSGEYVVSLSRAFVLSRRGLKSRSGNECSASRVDTNSFTSPTTNQCSIKEITGSFSSSTGNPNLSSREPTISLNQPETFAANIMSCTTHDDRSLVTFDWLRPLYWAKSSPACRFNSQTPLGQDLVPLNTTRCSPRLMKPRMCTAMPDSYLCFRDNCDEDNKAGPEAELFPNTKTDLHEARVGDKIVTSKSSHKSSAGEGLSVEIPEKPTSAELRDRSSGRIAMGMASASIRRAHGGHIRVKNKEPPLENISSDTVKLSESSTDVPALSTFPTHHNLLTDKRPHPILSTATASHRRCRNWTDMLDHKFVSPERQINVTFLHKEPKISKIPVHNPNERHPRCSGLSQRRKTGNVSKDVSHNPHQKTPLGVSSSPNKQFEERRLCNIGRIPSQSHDKLWDDLTHSKKWNTPRQRSSLDSGQYRQLESLEFPSCRFPEKQPEMYLAAPNTVKSHNSTSALSECPVFNNPNKGIGLIPPSIQSHTSLDSFNMPMSRASISLPPVHEAHHDNGINHLSGRIIPESSGSRYFIQAAQNEPVTPNSTTLNNGSSLRQHQVSQLLNRRTSSEHNIPSRDGRYQPDGDLCSHGRAGHLHQPDHKFGWHKPRDRKSNPRTENVKQNFGPHKPSAEMYRVPDLASSMRSFPAVPDLPSSTRSCPAVPDLPSSTRSCPAVPDLPSSTRSCHAVPDLPSSTRSCPAVPDLPSSTRSCPAVPDLPSSTRSCPAVPDLPSSTRSCPAVPDLASSTRSFPAVPDLPSSMRSFPAVRGSYSSDRFSIYGVTSLLAEGSNTSRLRHEQEHALSPPSVGMCPACLLPFDCGKRRKITDSCGHQRCFSCLFSSDLCPVCCTQERQSPPPPPPDVAQNDLRIRLGLLLGHQTPQ